MSSRAAYLRAAAELWKNAGQWEAYESKGHCVVLAGPGSGKTRTLTTKMARMLAEDIPEPRGIACITFNNECARELEERLASLGVEPGGRVFVGTVHSFSLTQIILPYQKVAGMGLPDGFGVARRVEREAAMRETLARAGGYRDYSEWNPRLGEYRRRILNRTSAAWRQNEELADLVEAFEAELRRRGLIDFDDMPLLAVRALQAHPWLQRALLAKYPVLVVDEYQDLAAALHRMVLGLCFRAGMRLFAVGDIDQSIYGFTGAQPELLKTLSERDDVQTVTLQMNYRCGSRIVAAAQAALGEDRDFEAAEDNGQGAVFIHAMQGSAAVQARHLVHQLIPQALARHPGLSHRDIAVLYPAAKVGNHIAAAAEDAGLEIIRTDGNALYPRGSRIMQWLEVCGQWCCGGWQSGRPAFSRVLRDGRRLFSEVLFAETAVMDFHAKLIGCLWERRDAGLKVHAWLNDLIEQVIEPFGDGCAALRDDLEVLEDFMAHVAPDGSHEGMVLGSLAGDGGQLDRITLSTLHSAKGREFSLVFMFGFDSYFPHPRSTPNEVAEKRRTFYVGLTRAKKEVHLVHPAGNASPFVNVIQNHLNKV